MKKRAEHEDGFVLHTYAYKETSLIVEAFSRRYGRVALLARGARRPRSAMRGVLLSFHPLRLSWSGGMSNDASLGTLIAAEWSGALPSLAGRSLMCGFYLNELLLRLLPREDAHEALFDAYAAALERLAASEASPSVLRSFERRLLGELGYAPLLDRDAADRPIAAEGTYLYEPDQGPVALHGPAPDSRLVVSGRTLLDMAGDRYERAETRDQARTLMRALIGARLHGQELHTRSVLLELNEL